MKNTIITILFLISGIAYAQHPTYITVPLEESTNREYSTRDYTIFKDLNHSLDKFIGTWLYTDGNKSFKITFLKVENVVTTNKFQKEDILISRYEYKVNNTVVFETYSTGVSEVTSSILLNPNNIVFIYSEPSFTSCEKARYGNLTLTYSTSGSQQLLNWVRTDIPIREKPIPCSDGTPADVSDFLAPANMVLVKQ